MKLRMLCVAVAATCSAGLTSAAPPSPTPGATTPVQVMNPASSPVPVTGGVQVTNTNANPVPVTIPAGAAITGDVEITNTTPIPVAIDHSAANQPTPFNKGLTCAQPGACDGFKVPVGKRLVIEQLTGTCRSTGPYLVQLGVRAVASGVEAFHGLPPLWTLNTGTSDYGVLYSFGGLTRIYADPDTSVQVNPNILTLNSGNYSCSATISGYLIPT